MKSINFKKRGGKSKGEEEEIKPNKKKEMIKRKPRLVLPLFLEDPQA